MTKIAMSRAGVKRWLETPFALCGAPEDLTKVGEAIIKQASTLRGHGWIRVDTAHPDESPANTEPVPWEK
jgi:hypothetical protein